MAEKSVTALNEAAAREELARLTELLTRANSAYHGKDDPFLSDAEYDRLKKRTAPSKNGFRT